jgi:hypothetical protein
MDTKARTMLESKLTVFKICYQQAEKQKDQKRMDRIEVFIDELQEEINGLI